jgi:protocatechuate 3,4-dioxygenase beta subunit
LFAPSVITHVGGTAAALTFLFCNAPAYAEQFKGTVIGPDENPIAGATVIAHGYARETDKSPTSIIVKTDAKGEFTFELGKVIYGTAKEGAWGWVSVVPPDGSGLAARQLYVNTTTPSPLRFSLLPGRTVSGVVTDAAGKPLPKIKVALSTIYAQRLNNDPGPDKNLHASTDPALQEHLSAVTDAAGRWTIPHLQKEGEAIIGLQQAPYVHSRIRYELGKSQADAPPLVARPGATFTGKVVTADGKPVAGISVSTRLADQYMTIAGDEVVVAVTTGVDGTYRIGGLPTNRYHIIVSQSPDSTTVAPAIPGVAIKEGESKTLPDLVLGDSILVEGTVIHTETGKPIKDIYIMANSTDMPESPGFGGHGAMTDAQGRFRFRVAPGPVRIQVAGFGPEGRRLEDNIAPVAVEAKKGATVTVPALRVKFAAVRTVAGTVVDEAGKPVPGVAVFVSTWNEPEAQRGERQSVSDAQGAFTCKNIQGPDSAQQIFLPPGWEIVSPAKLTFPTSEPFRLVVRKVKLYPLMGRVVTTDGTPIPDMNINYFAYTGQYENTHQGNMSTDAQGRFTVNTLKPGQTVQISVYHDDYRWKSGGKTAYTEATGFTMTDLILTPLTARRIGLVKDANGKPAAGALVWVTAGGKKAVTRTDAKGAFSLGNIPAGKVVVRAAKGRDVGEATTAESATTPVTVTLAPANPALTPAEMAQRGRALLAEGMENTKSWQRGHYAGQLARFDFDTAIRLAAGPEGRIPEDAIARFTVLAAEADPLRAANQLVPMLAEVRRLDARFNALYQLGRRNAAHPAIAARLYNDLVATFGQMDKGQQEGAAASIASLALRLRMPDAASWVARVEETARTKEKDDPDYLLDASQTIAEGDPTTAERLLANQPEPQRTKALLNLVPAIAPQSIATARRLLEQGLDSMEKKGDAGDYDMHYRASRAVFATLKVMDASDPAASLAIARRLSDISERPIALALAARAYGKKGDIAKRAEIYQEAMSATQRGGTGQESFKIAAMGQEDDPKLGRELWQPLADRYLNGDHGVFIFYADIDFPMGYGPLDPAFGRMLVERGLEYTILEALRQQSVAGPTGPQLVGGSAKPEYQGVARLAAAMVTADVDAAVEAARAIPDEEARRNALRRIGAYLIAASTPGTTLTDRRAVLDAY